jgi:hypothetical protein
MYELIVVGILGQTFGISPPLKVDDISVLSILIAVLVFCY